MLNSPVALSQGQPSNSIDSPIVPPHVDVSSQSQLPSPSSGALAVSLSSQPEFNAGRVSTDQTSVRGTPSRRPRDHAVVAQLATMCLELRDSDSGKTFTHLMGNVRQLRNSRELNGRAIAEIMLPGRSASAPITIPSQKS